MKTLVPHWLFLVLLTLLAPANPPPAAAADPAPLAGNLDDGSARVVIEAQVKGSGRKPDRLLFATSLEHAIRASNSNLIHAITAQIEILQGDPAELLFTVTGEGALREVRGPHLRDWSLRQETNGTRTLVLRVTSATPPITNLTVEIAAEQRAESGGRVVEPLTLIPQPSALFQGYLKIEWTRDLHLELVQPAGLARVDRGFLPERLRNQNLIAEAEALAFRFHGSAYSAPFRLTFSDPDARRVVLRDFDLNGQITEGVAAFTLRARVSTKNPNGASLTLLSGAVAVSEFEPDPAWRLQFENNRYVLRVLTPGEFLLQIRFHAAMDQDQGWNRLSFHVAPAALQPLRLSGLPEKTRIEFAAGAPPRRVGNDYVSYLPPDGSVALRWQNAPTETEGKLFYAAEMLSQINIGPGLHRQVSHLDFKVMQGEMNQVVLRLRGPGNVTRVQGATVLSWQNAPVADPGERRLVVQLNEPQKTQFALQIETQSEVGQFPAAIEALQVHPENATQFNGFIRVVNEGAVRLEVTQATGLSQISPGQFPETDSTRALFPAPGSQRFAFRFSAGQFALRIQADQIRPEIGVSQVITYHFGGTELAIDIDLELDIREAPVRELLLRLPLGFAVAQIQASGLSDYFSTENQALGQTELRLVYAQPVFDRQVIQFRLERNGALEPGRVTLPRITLVDAKQTRVKP